MKVVRTQKKPAGKLCAPGKQALTLVETMIATGIFGLVMFAAVYTQLFILKYDELSNSKLGASDNSRLAFDTLTSEIRSAKIWHVGNGTLTAFTQIPNGTNQQGNALQLFLSTDTNQYIVYYFDTNSDSLRRRHSGVSGYTTIAQNLTNYLAPLQTNGMYFRGENYRGQPVTDLSFAYVIHVIMGFYQYQYPLTRVGSGYFYDLYKLEFKVTPHCPDGA